MSYLGRPRLHFYGKALVNPPTANNATTDWKGVQFYDPANVQLDLQGRSPEQFAAWLHQLNYEGYVNALWNYYGDNGIRLIETTITAADLPERDIRSANEDACIGSSVQLLGSPYRAERSPAVLVDLDPTDGFTTQLFGQYFSISDGGHIFLEADTPFRTYSRWVNFWRNLEVGGDRGSSAIWQIAFPREAIKLNNNNNLEASPTIGAFQEALNDAQGLVMRLCFYLFHHMPYKTIAQNFQDNQRVSLPGQLVVAGTLGMWDKEETATLPPARNLMPDLATPLDIPDSIQSQRQHTQFFLGAALAQADTTRKVITLDLVNTFPEIAAFDTLQETVSDIPEKINLGDISLQVVEGETVTCIGALGFKPRIPGQPTYDKAGLLLTGGIIEMPYPPEIESQILAGDLVLLHGIEPDAPILLRESAYHVLVDQRNLYLELEDPTPHTISFQVIRYGQPLTEPLTLHLEQTVNHSSRFAEDQNRIDPRTTDERLDHTARRVLQQGDVVSIPIEVTTDAAGFGEIPIGPARAGMCKIWLTSPTDPDLTQVGLDSMRYFLKNSLHTFINVRVLPDDRYYDTLPDEALTWEFMVEHFFQYYALLYPIMNHYIDFTNQAETEANAPMIAAFVSEHLFNSTIYMPITRELSAGKRRLVQRWARLMG